MIRHFLIATTVLCFATPALAQNQVKASGIGNHVQGQQQNQLQRVRTTQANSTTQNEAENFRQAPAFGTPGLSASDEACMGSSSGGAGVSAGAIGVSVAFGSTWESWNCNLRMFAQQLRLAGSPKAALILLGNHPEVNKALIEAGVIAAPVTPTPARPTASNTTSDKHPACSPTSWATADTRKALGC